MNKKGFTLIEILGATVILGILSLVAIVSVSKVIDRSREEHNTAAEQQLKIAAENFAQQNRKYLPKVVGETKTIKLKDLVEKKYIKSIKDYSKNDCDLDKSYVKVFKYSNSDYSYTPYLQCPSYNSKQKINDLKPEITITINDSTNKSNRNAKIFIKSKEKLISWKYTIYRNDVEVKNSGSIILKDYNKEVSKTIDLAEYNEGKIKIVVSATSISGITSTVESRETEFKENVKPLCVIDSKDRPTAVKGWSKEPVKITVGCDDQGGSGCVKSKYTKTFKTSTKIGTIKIKDKQGNETDCKVLVNMDNTPPAVPNLDLDRVIFANGIFNKVPNVDTYLSNTWSNMDIQVKAKNSEKTEVNQSGLAYYEYLLNGSVKGKNNIKVFENEGTNKIKFRACDKAGNCSKYTQEKIIKIDKTAPVIKSTSFNMNNKTATLNAVFEDNLSGIGGVGYKLPPYTNVWTTTKKYNVPCGKTYNGYAQAIDLAGNVSNVINLGQKASAACCSVPSGSCSSEGSVSKCNGVVKTCVCDYYDDRWWEGPQGNGTPGRVYTNEYCSADWNRYNYGGVHPGTPDCYSNFARTSGANLTDWCSSTLAAQGTLTCRVDRRRGGCSWR